MRAAGLLLICFFALISACSAPKADLAEGAITPAVQAPPGTGRFDHTAFGRVLASAVHPDIGRVDYSAIDQPTLAAYVGSLGTADLSTLSMAEREALLINAYNAFTLTLILEQPTRPASIRDLTDPWKTARWTLAGQVLSLNEIEHGLLRPIFKDPRLHFTLNCASIGCPPLAATPYVGSDLDARLTAAARDALARPQNLRIDGQGLAVTKLLNWYGGDFTATGWSPIAATKAQWLAKYGPAKVAALVAKNGADTSLRFIDYDWALNDLDR
ncbi:MAG: DUF547 domain-containing protein [Oligoflexia bacterium]|nr:DUF547 domain-containing protein [Oligoflexia bacterium]